MKNRFTGFEILNLIRNFTKYILEKSKFEKLDKVSMSSYFILLSQKKIYEIC